MENAQDIQISYSHASDGRVSYNISTRVSDDNVNLFHVVINDLNKNATRLPGSDAAIINFFRLDSNDDSADYDKLNEEDLTYQMSVYDHTVTSSASVIEIRGGVPGDEETTVETVTIEQKFRPMSCVFDVVSENTNLQFTTPPCQMSLIFPCTQDSRDTVFNTSNGTLVTRYGNGVGCFTGCCNTSVIEADTTSYTIQFSDSATVESKLLTIFGCMFIEHVRFSNNITYTEYVKKIEE